jgi:hypothetical protein
MKGGYIPTKKLSYLNLKACGVVGEQTKTLSPFLSDPAPESPSPNPPSPPAQPHPWGPIFQISEAIPLVRSGLGV